MKCSAPYNSVDLDGIEDRVQTGALHKLDFAGLRVRVKNNGKPQCSIEDTNGDGFDDLVCRFEDNAANWHPDEGYAVLTGSLKNGDPFEGSDSICVEASAASISLTPSTVLAYDTDYTLKLTDATDASGTNIQIDPGATAAFKTAAA